MYAGRGAFDRRFEIGKHLEDIGKIGVLRIEHPIQAGIADQDHLNVQRDRLGLEQRSRRKVGDFGGDDLQLAGFQRTQQNLPRAGFGQDIAGFQHQIAAIRAQQGAGVNHHMIGTKRAGRHELPVDIAEQVLQVRRSLDDDRPAFPSAMTEHQIGPVEAGVIHGDNLFGSLKRDLVNCHRYYPILLAGWRRSAPWRPRRAEPSAAHR